MEAHRPSTAGFVIWREILSAIAILCTMMSSGCQILSIADLETPVEEAPVTPTSPSDLQRLLAAGHWEIDREWTLLKSSDLEAWRWKFVIPEPPAKSADDATISSDLPDDLAELCDRYVWVREPRPEVPANHVAELDTVSKSSDSASWTAAILLARRSVDPHQSAALHDKLAVPADSAIDVSVVAATRAAAVETWCRKLSTLPGDPEGNFAAAGRMLDDEKLAEDVRGELYRGIARRIAPRHIPGLNEIMLRQESAQLATPLHRAAIEACLIHARHQQEKVSDQTFMAEDWPDGLWHCRFAKDTSLRKLFGRWAALAHHPDALALLKSQRHDIDLGVREEAVTSLGYLDGSAAHDELLAVMAKGTDPERVAAVVCLAHHDGEDFQRFARDESPRVRMAAARELGRTPTRTSAVILADLMRDRSSDVQLAALSACEAPAWREHGRVSLLLHALRVGSLPAQMAALSQLRTEWGLEPIFPLNGTYEERDSAVRALALEHNVSTEVFTAFREADTARQPAETALVRQEDVRRLIRDFLHGSAAKSETPVSLEELKSLEPSAVVVLEQELDSAAGPQAEIVYRDVLPKLHPGYAALLSMESPEPALRRRGAKGLRAVAEGRSLSVTLLRRLAKRMAAEQDRQVWQETTAAILPDALPEAAQIALIALNSPWPDIRHMGCDYFERHPQPEYAAWLLPRLQDAERPVRIRAIRLLGRCGNPVALDGYRDDSESSGLRKLLIDADLQLRWEAVLAMSALGDAQAAQEIIRQSYDSHPRQRELAVLAMGQTGQTRFLEHLLRRSWTESDPGVQQALLKSLDQLAPRDDRPGLAPESPISDKITQWARWWEARQQTAASK